MKEAKGRIKCIPGTLSSDYLKDLRLHKQSLQPSLQTCKMATKMREQNEKANERLDE